ncbi:sensor histidine kinase [Lysobacter cavernae]|uniref:Sensor histidine kinase n=1 Tax=Lysobacter cavernae TaxID=1685901 RepID=A0ABV7RWB2_9GAMM
MREVIRSLLQPLNLPALLTWAAVALSLRYDDDRATPALWAAMLGWLLAFLLVDVFRKQRVRTIAAVFVVEAVCALAVVWLAPSGGTAPVLLVVQVAQLAMTYSMRTTLVAVLAINLALYVVLRIENHSAAAVVVLIFMGFQGFAALIAHYARSAEDTRDRLALVNADLLATRALLADSTRDRERLRVARELHDVAGHKLTALTLNLRAMAVDPAYAGRREIVLAQQMSSELLGDIRGIVQAIRDERGLDLATALRALAAPLPRPALQLRIDDGVRITDADTAEAILRLVQEALTNSARHADADVIHVVLSRAGDRLRVSVEDDGRLRGPVREGNGLAGMRERIAAAGGTLALSTSARGALRIEASLPA